MADEMRPCPRNHGKPCVESIPVRTSDAMCLGCRRGGRKLGYKVLEQRFGGNELKRETIKFKCMAREQLHEGSSKRQGHLCGITDAIPSSRIIGFEISDFIAFQNTVVEAAKKTRVDKVVRLCRHERRDVCCEGRPYCEVPVIFD